MKVYECNVTGTEVLIVVEMAGHGAVDDGVDRDDLYSPTARVCRLMRPFRGEWVPDFGRPLARAVLTLFPERGRTNFFNQEGDLKVALQGYLDTHKEAVSRLWVGDDEW
jgi:hypothetical protein